MVHLFRCPRRLFCSAPALLPSPILYSHYLEQKLQSAVDLVYLPRRQALDVAHQKTERVHRRPLCQRPASVRQAQEHYPPVLLASHPREIARALQPVHYARYRAYVQVDPLAQLAQRYPRVASYNAQHSKLWPGYLELLLQLMRMTLVDAANKPEGTNYPLDLAALVHLPLSLRLQRSASCVD